MDYLKVFNAYQIGIYCFAEGNMTQRDRITDFLSYLKKFGEYTIIEDMNSLKQWNHSEAILIFIVTSLTDFNKLKCLNYLHQSLNLIAYFISTEEFKVVNDKKFRVSIQDKFFFIIHPTENEQGFIYPHKNKILDTIFFKTKFRTKYQGNQIAENITNYLGKDITSEIATIQEIGAYFDTKNLNPDGKAGAIAIRCDQGVLINAANTHKSYITAERVCYLTQYCLKKNKVSYIGKHFPSSESAVAWLAFQTFPQANCLLHFHCKQMTYSRHLGNYRTNKYVAYGTPGEAKKLIRQFEKSNLAIANGHGEFVLSSSLEEAREIINQLI